MDSTSFIVVKEEYGIILQRKGTQCSFVGDRYFTREEHKKYWKTLVGATIKKEDFDVEIFPNVGDGYYDSDYAVPKGYKCTEEYKEGGIVDFNLEIK